MGSHTMSTTTSCERPGYPPQPDTCDTTTTSTTTTTTISVTTSTIAEGGQDVAPTVSIASATLLAGVFIVLLARLARR